MLSSLWALDERWLGQVTEAIDRRRRGDTLADLRAAVANGQSSGRPTAPRGLVVLRVAGLLEKQRSWMGEFFGSTSTQELIGHVDAAVAAPTVAGIILLVDSGGGEVDGTEEAAAVIRAARDKKPVIGVIDGMAGSAAYWIASQASHVTLSPSGEVGSIGVYGVHASIARNLEADGIDVTLIRSTPKKAETLPFIPLSASAKASLQALVDHHHGVFVRDVARGRRVSEAHVLSAYGQGRTLLSQNALRAGMIDAIAAPQEGLRLAADYVGRISAVSRARSHAYQLAQIDPDAAHEKLMALDSRPVPFRERTASEELEIEELKALHAQWEREDRRHAGR